MVPAALSTPIHPYSPAPPAAPAAMPSKTGSAPVVGGRDEGLRRDVGLVALLFTGVGAIIGSGWLFGAFYAAKETGPAAVVSWSLGAVMILFIALSYAELGAMFPVSGGVVRYPHFGFGGFASYTAGWVNWLAAASVAPIEVEAALQYATNYLHWLTRSVGGIKVLAPGGYAVAVVLMAIFVIVNFYGVKWFAKLNTVIVWWKLLIISLAVAALLAVKLIPHRLVDAGSAAPLGWHDLLSHGGFAPLGWHGVFSAIATTGIVFSYLGFRQGIELAGESQNPHRAVPIAVIGSVLLCGLIYVLLQVAFLGALPGSSLVHGWAKLEFQGDFGPLAGIAKILGLSWLAALLYFDAVVSPADTGLIYTTATARLSYAMAKNGNAPEGLAKLNKHGVPWLSLALAFVVGLIFFLPFPGWQELVGFITSASVLSFGSGPLVMGALRRELPDQARPFKVPFGDVIPFLAFASSNLVVYWTGWDINWKLFVAMGLGFVLLGFQHLSNGVRAGDDRVRGFSFVLLGVRRPVEGRLMDYDWKAGSWVFPWLIGLALISYLGGFGHGRNLLEFGSGAAAVVVFSLVIYAWAMIVRLPAREVRKYLGEELHETPEPVPDQGP